MHRKETNYKAGWENVILMVMKKVVNSVSETQALAMQLAQIVQAGDTILLNGDLGVGKTTFTQGFARQLGIKRPIKSPTFTLVREYQTVNFPLYHLDVYRLGEEGGAKDLGLDEYFGGEGVALVEWSQYISSELPADRLEINITRWAANPTSNKRLFTVSAQGDTARQRLEEWEATLGIDN